ncbi:NAD-dependent DNA ligase LigA [Natronoarchaeum sp. GCM10025321]|uniref:NAD-dependent DNA ligase LigA n=1 Tax=Natronoarchaeum sp. GCM10025321 TaxID=3252684 RepID=UPI00360DFC80
MPPALEDNPYIEEPETEFEAVESLSREAAREQAEQLREAIRYHDRQYYLEADPVIADRAYDALFERLQTLEETFDLDREGSPTQRVGGEPVEAFDTVEHVAPMLSIEGSEDVKEIRAFAERVESEFADVSYVCEPKFDGISIEVVYNDGQLERAVTRGDGQEGDDVTANVRTIRSIPLQLSGDYPEFLAVRGEIYMPRDAFQAYNRELVERGEDPFANPRNATAGTIRQHDPTVVAERPLDCFFFEVLDASREWETRYAEDETLPEYGLRVNEHTTRVEGIDEAIEYRDGMLERRDDLNYEIDGVVIKVNDRDQRETLGATSRHYRWAMAYKFPARTEETTVREIAVQVGRTGRLTPVALLDPVDVGGVTVARASLHNPDEIARLGVDVGDRVRIERAGDVIPQVAEVLEDGDDGHFEFPETCPVCDSAVERDGPMAHCTGGIACDAQLRESIVYYGSDDGLDIEGLGERTVRQLLDAGLIDGLPDLYRISPDELAELEGWGEQSTQNLVDAIEATTEPPLAEFLSALGVPHVGPATARELAREFGDLDTLMDADVDALRSVDEVGEVVAREIHDFFASEANRAVIAALRKEGVEPQSAETSGGDELDGLTVVFTGSLDEYTRSEAQELVEAHGGSATSSVSGNTDYLVTGENPGATKVDDAEAEAVERLSEAEFEALLEEQGVETANV